MKQHILVVDDNPDLSETMAELLKDLGYSSSFANSLDGALLLARNNSFDAVISDLHMPAGDGIRLRSLMAADERLSSTPFIYMTGKIDDIPKLHEAVLVKPFTTDDLVAILDGTLSSKT